MHDLLLDSIAVEVIGSDVAAQFDEAFGPEISIVAGSASATFDAADGLKTQRQRLFSAESSSLSCWDGFDDPGKCGIPVGRLTLSLTFDLHKGTVIRHGGHLFSVLDYSVARTGNQRPIVRVRLRSTGGKAPALLRGRFHQANRHEGPASSVTHLRSVDRTREV